MSRAQGPLSTWWEVRGFFLFFNGNYGCRECHQPHHIGNIYLAYSKGSPGVTSNSLSDPQFFSSFWNLLFSMSRLEWAITHPGGNISQIWACYWIQGRRQKKISGKGDGWAKTWNCLMTQCGWLMKSNHLLRLTGSSWKCRFLAPNTQKVKPGNEHF